jgi:D-glycero-D-manno-heptose 1,7-bisphosphate phosphatase
MTVRFAVLDRDGTINVERDHLTDPAELELIPGSAEAVRRLRDELGLGVVVITNQAHVGRGVLPVSRLIAIHERLQELLAAKGTRADAILYCPHAPEDGCACRKPRPGLVLEAADRFGFEPSDSFVVGDHESDVAMGRSIGATTFLVLTGHGRDEAERAAAFADHVVPDLAAATAIIAGLVGKET